MSFFRAENESIIGKPLPPVLNGVAGDKITVIIFYPGDFTPVCTKQLCSYNSNKELVEMEGVIFIAVSPDTEKSHEEFSKRYGFKFKLVSDPGKELFDYFGMMTLTLAGRGIVVAKGGAVVAAVKERLPLTYMGAEELKELVISFI
ncbi:MAG TPA: redoxin domain-containing protein [Candidatus Wallbacteria bacterium]|nr:redoxin domain-containing protein [Candidatus Wallbacteria bacterium]